MPVLPNSSFGSTTFNNKITSYELLAQRIKRMMGAPLVQIEISDEQIYEVIDTACEFYTKFAGTTEEFLIFKSDLYIKNVGLPIGRLINNTPDLKSSPNPDLVEYPINYQNSSPLAGSEYSAVIGNGVNNFFDINHGLNSLNVIVQVYDNLNNEIVFPGIQLLDENIARISFNYVIPADSFRVVFLLGATASSYHTFIGDGVSKIYTVTHNLSSADLIAQVTDIADNQVTYVSIINNTINKSTLIFNEPVPQNYYRVSFVSKTQNEKLDPTYALTHSAGWDYDLNQYRKVIDVTSFEQGNNSGINTLFTIEHTIAQQAYFGHLLGNVGYDLITWQALKGWLDTREKVLAMTPYLRFNPDTQMLKIIPEPNTTTVYYGVVCCQLQKPIKDIVSQLWVYRYSLALSKMLVAHTRGKYSGTNLFGGQTVNASDLMSQGLAEKEKLELEIMSDLVDRDPIKFFIG